MNPHVLVIQQDPTDQRFLDDATIRSSLTHSGCLSSTEAEDCAIERIQADSFSSTRGAGFDLVILQYQQVGGLADRSRYRRLETPVILLAEEGDRQQAEALSQHPEFDVVVRTPDLETQLSECFSRVALKASLERTRRELLRARLAQRALLPSDAPFIPGFDVAGKIMPARIVGGDFYDFATTKDQNHCFLIGDVTGHGLNAALRMAETQAYFRAFLRCPGAESVEPASILSRVNGLLVETCADMPLLATSMIVSLCPSTHSFVWSGAGHQGYLLRYSGEIEPLHSTGPVLGCVDGIGYSTVGPRDLEPGDAILLATDGIAETCSTGVTLFGRDRMLDCIRNHSDHSAAETLDVLFEQAQQFRGHAAQKDDMTAVLVRVTD